MSSLVLLYLENASWRESSPSWKRIIQPSSNCISGLLRIFQISQSVDRREFIKASAAGLAVASIGSSMTSCANIRTKDAFDTIIKGGTVYDGTGKNGTIADVGIREGKIAAIEKDLGKNAKTVIDASGLIVSPGFIDLHSHSDTNYFQAQKADSRIYQGVTSEVGGNCGYAPFVYSDEAWKKKEGTDRYGYPAWRNIDGFYETLAKHKIGINYSSLVGHGDVREAVVGPYNVPSTPEDIKKMCSILEQQLEMGAIGLSFGLEYAPGCYSDTREMVQLCKTVAKYNALYTIHMRNEDDRVLEALDEAIEVARQSQARVEISHLKAQNPANFDKLPQLLAKIDAARAEGIDIAFDRYPYTAFSTGFTSFIPIELRDGTDEDILRRLNSPKESEQIKKYAYLRLQKFGGADKVLVAGCNDPSNQAYAGKNLAQCCEISGMNEWEMIRHLLVSENLSVQQATFAMSEENLEMIYAHPLSMPISDGSVYSPEGELGKEIPHPRSYGTFPRFFESFVREKKVVDMATAIYKCTGLPASRMKLKERGLLVPGYAADVTIFDAGKIADISTYAKPHTFAAGIVHVLVNGVHTINEGKHTGALAGVLLDNAHLSR